jgi:hypothetical protein
VALTFSVSGSTYTGSNGTSISNVACPA